MEDEKESPMSINMLKKVEKLSRFKRVCVFCGSNTGKRVCYQDAAVELGKELVARKMDLVYGGGSIGLMGLVSEAVHSGGGNVIGIMPRTLVVKEGDPQYVPYDDRVHKLWSTSNTSSNVAGETPGELKAVSGMHQRRAEMARHSDAFIALPGGYGTLNELLEVISWAQLGIHKKPVGLLNVDGYYNSLLAFIDKAVDDGFIKPFQRNIIISVPNAKDLVQKLEDYVPVQGETVEELRWEWEQVGYNSALHAELATLQGSISAQKEKSADCRPQQDKI